MHCRPTQRSSAFPAKILGSFLQIYNGKLTALTQYNEFNVFPRLIAMKQEVSELVRDFVESDIVPRLGELRNFILDIVLISSTPQVDRFSNLKPVIIELNPIGEFAGTGLFNWLTGTQLITKVAVGEFDPTLLKSRLTLLCDVGAQINQCFWDRSRTSFEFERIFQRMMQTTCEICHLSGPALSK